MFSVYVLYSNKYQKHYTGFSSDLHNRILSHNELATKGWSIKYRPWRLIYSKDFSDKSEAIKHEKWLKSGTGRKFISSLPH